MIDLVLKSLNFWLVFSPDYHQQKHVFIKHKAVDMYLDSTTLVST